MANIITADIGGSKIRFGLVNEKKEIVEHPEVSEIRISGIKLNNENLLELLQKNIALILDYSKKEHLDVIAISIGSPGPIDFKRGLIKNPPNLPYLKDFAIVDKLKNIFPLPIFLLNDADAGLLGERWLREKDNYKDIVYITLSTGVGSGVLKNNELMAGSELGHQVLNIPNSNRICSCGEMNHAEAYLGTKGLAETYSEVFGVIPDDQNEISPKMRLGVIDKNQEWLMVQNKYSRHLAAFIIDTISKFNPEIIILGGGIAFENNALLQKTIGQSGKINTKIELALSKFNVNLGAARYALDALSKRG